MSLIECVIQSQKELIALPNFLDVQLHQKRYQLTSQKKRLYADENH